MAGKIKDIYLVSDDFPVTTEKYDIWLKALLNKIEDEVKR